MGNFQQSSAQRNDEDASEDGQTTITATCGEKTKKLEIQRNYHRHINGSLRDLGFEFRRVPCNNVEKHTMAEGDDCFCFDCATRLFHVKSNTMITSENRKRHIPDGPTFEDVSHVAQQVAVQEHLIPKFKCQLATLKPPNDEFPELTALLYVDSNDDNDDSGDNNPDDNNARSTFLFITGKGLSRAGIISVKQLIESGIEQGSVLYFLLQARKRKWNAMFVDPNAWGVAFGMKAVQTSLEILLEKKKGPCHVLAHSAAGGYMVRYLIERPDLPITSLIFTDSTHRIAWARNNKKNQTLYDFLQSSRCLYIRNNALGNPFAVNNSDHGRLPGESTRTDVWWEQRFGKIRTVWGGTVDHAALCWSARQVIWEFMDGVTNNSKA